MSYDNPFTTLYKHLTNAAQTGIRHSHSVTFIPMLLLINFTIQNVMCYG